MARRHESSCGSSTATLVALQGLLIFSLILCGTRELLPGLACNPIRCSSDREPSQPIFPLHGIRSDPDDDQALDRGTQRDTLRNQKKPGASVSVRKKLREGARHGGDIVGTTILPSAAARVRTSISVSR